MDSIERRRTLMASLKESYVLFGRNAATNKEARMLPQELYVRSEELSVFFEGDPDAWFLDERYSHDQIDAFRMLGVSNDLRIQARPGDRKGHVTVHRSHGSHKRGLDGFDPECTVEHLEYAVQSPTLERSLFIWKNIAIPLQRQIRGTVEKATRQTLRTASLTPRSLLWVSYCCRIHGCRTSPGPSMNHLNYHWQTCLRHLIGTKVWQVIWV